MLIRDGMSMAGPWPLKVVIDNVLGHHPLPNWLHWVRDLPLAQSKMGLASLAAITVILIAFIGGVAMVHRQLLHGERQTMGRERPAGPTFDHLQRLSLGYYEKQQTGVLLFHDYRRCHDAAELRVLCHPRDSHRSLTIVGVVGLMFWLTGISRWSPSP